MVRKTIIPARAIRTRQDRPATTTFFITLSDNFERSRPACLREEIRDKISDLLDAVHYVGSTVFIRIRFIRPVDDQPFPDDELARNEAPVAAVGAVVAVIAHGEIKVRRNDDLAVFRKVFIPIRVFVDTTIDPPRMGLGREKVPEW